MSPAKGLVHEHLEGTEKAKARLTLALCCNATGTERLPPWLIGTSARPRAF